MPLLAPREKVAKNFAPFLYAIFKNLAKVKNRPIGENSPNLVTLMYLIL
jgi:hypothetical protein